MFIAFFYSRVESKLWTHEIKLHIETARLLVILLEDFINKWPMHNETLLSLLNFQELSIYRGCLEDSGVYKSSRGKTEV